MAHLDIRHHRIGREKAEERVVLRLSFLCKACLQQVSLGSQFPLGWASLVEAHLHCSFSGTPSTTPPTLQAPHQPGLAPIAQNAKISHPECFMEDRRGDLPPWGGECCPLISSWTSSCLLLLTHLGSSSAFGLKHFDVIYIKETTSE